MQEPSKPRGLAKLWREVKRPFRRLRHKFRQSIRKTVGYNDLAQLCRELHQDLRNELHGLHQDLRNELHGLHKDLWQDLTDFIQRSITTALLHQKTFSKFKNIHQGQEIVLVACGPTAKDYKRIDGAIHIGVNRAFRLESIDLQYLFMQDFFAIKSYIKEANQYKPGSCTKFYGWNDKIPVTVIPTSVAVEANALRYRTDWTNNKYPCQFHYFIDSEPFGDFMSVVFSAIQFALWTNPKTIFLVGCDCSSGYFDGPTPYDSCSSLMQGWMQLKEFAELYYPETKILSINPVGLKGVFDEYRQT